MSKITESLKAKLQQLGFEEADYPNTYTHPQLACAVFDFTNTADSYPAIMSTSFAATIAQTEESVANRLKSQINSFKETLGL